MRPDIDREKFGYAVAAVLERRGLSTRAAGVLPGLNPAMISRATTGQVLSAASMLTLCRVFRLNPFDYLIAQDFEPDQAVTAIVPRETGGVRP